MTQSRWFAFAIVISVLGSLALAASCGDDDDDDDDDTAYDDDTGDDDSGDDDTGDDDAADDDAGGDCTTADLCVPVSECDFGLSQDECEETFLDQCQEGGDVDSYLICMCDFIAAYADDGDCDAFESAELSCWEVAGC